MLKGKKFAVINSYQRVAIPIEFLPKFLEVAMLVEVGYEDGKNIISGVDDLDKIEIYDGVQFDLAVAHKKLTT